MALELKMPALSPTMEEGTLAKWLVKVGDEVKSGDILAIRTRLRRIGSPLTFASARSNAAWLCSMTASFIRGPRP